LDIHTRPGLGRAASLFTSCSHRMQRLFSWLVFTAVYSYVWLHRTGLVLTCLSAAEAAKATGAFRLHYSSVVIIFCVPVDRDRMISSAASMVNAVNDPFTRLLSSGVRLSDFAPDEWEGCANVETKQGCLPNYISVGCDDSCPCRRTVP